MASWARAAGSRVATLLRSQEGGLARAAKQWGQQTRGFAEGEECLTLGWEGGGLLGAAVGRCGGAARRQARPGWGVLFAGSVAGSRPVAAGVRR